MEILQNADTLVALQNIEPVHVFVCDDRISDPLIQMIPDYALPLPGKFTVFRHQRHEVGSEGSLPAGGLGADNLIKRNADKAKRLLRADALMIDNFIQSGQIRVFTF